MSKHLGIPESTVKSIEPTALHHALVEAARDSGLSIREIARRTGLDKSTVSHLLNFKREGTITSWSKILEACEVRIEV